jgi:hypothetical protein
MSRTVLPAVLSFTARSLVAASTLDGRPHRPPSASTRSRAAATRSPMASLPIHYDTASGQSLTFRVMHPVLIMESRAHNVIQLPAYRNPHGLGQVRASVHCAREYLNEMVSSNPRAVLRWNERIFRFRTKDPDGKQIAREHQIDVFNAVVADSRLDAKFLATRFPQMVELVRRTAT